MYNEYTHHYNEIEAILAFRERKDKYFSRFLALAKVVRAYCRELSQIEKDRIYSHYGL